MDPSSRRFWLLMPSCLVALLLFGAADRPALGQSSPESAVQDVGDGDVALALKAESPFQIGPIPGLTTGWHPAPETAVIPLGSTPATLTFKHMKHRGASVTWKGAELVAYDRRWSIAEFQVNAAGRHVVSVEYVYPSGKRIESRCILDIVDFPPERIRVSPVEVAVDPVVLDENDLNASTYAYFNGDSIAGLRRVSDDHYRTSTQRWVKLSVDVDPSEFAPLIEWRPSGEAPALGSSWKIRYSLPGIDTIGVGPTDNPQQIRLETYRVEITSHVSNRTVIPTGVPVTFKAVTHPPGYEGEITWLASTKYGSCDPVMGYGPEFNVRFTATWGPNQGPDRSFQWLGVKADNTVFNQDQKVDTGSCCLPDANLICQDDVTTEQCEGLHGSFQGDLRCDRVTCPLIVVGACCQPEGACTIASTESECKMIGGVYQGDDTRCGPDDTCPSGACCGGTGDCQILTPSQCKKRTSAFGTFYRGDDTTCKEHCPHGACCQFGVCSDRIPDVCLPPDGNYQGNGVECGNVVCPSPPKITNVTRDLQLFFLEGTDQDIMFLVDVDWAGTPGLVSFSIDGRAPITEPGTPSGASHTFNLESQFEPKFLPSVITISVVNGEGVGGMPVDEELFVFPRPLWLDEALSIGFGNLSFQREGDHVIASIELDYPDPHLCEDVACQVNIPTFVPYFGGDRIGLVETFARIGGSVSSVGTGSLELLGQTGFVALGGEVVGTVSGSGEFELMPMEGFELTTASFGLELAGVLKKKVGVVDAVPALSSLEGIPVIGRGVAWFNERATLTGSISPSLSFEAVFMQSEPGGDLEFQEATGTVKLKLKATLKINIIEDRLTASAWLGGSGSVTVGVPDPLLRRVRFSLQAGFNLAADFFLLSAEFEGTLSASCTWTPDGGVVCGLDKSLPVLLTADPEDISIQLMTRDYEVFGKYASFDTHGGSAPERQAVTLVANIYPAASPHYLDAEGGKLLLWEHQDLADPLLQSTEIAWAFEDETGWSFPELIFDDTRAEFSPVAGIDSEGRIVAAWLRIKDSSFSTPIEGAADLPLFYNQLEVVSATFDPVTRTWSEVTELTDNADFETSLRLSSDDKGNLMLTWLSNPGGEMFSTSASPSAMRYSFWDAGSSTWPSSGAVADGLVGVASHAAAIRHQAEAVIVLARDPSPGSEGDGVIDLYAWDGTAWSSASTFSAGSVDNRVPSVLYDAGGEGHVLWLRGENLVHATLSNPAPRVARSGSDSMAFYDGLFISSSSGDLAFLWTDVGANAPAEIFGIFYDAATGAWSEDQQLDLADGEEGERESRNVSGFYDGSGRLRLALLSTQLLRTSETVVIDGEEVTIDNIPQEGQTDLRLLVVDPDATDQIHR
jgi:hypothetical protein